MLGFVLIQNFDSPYQADSITEFWRRWHISLSTWLRDYLYIPLGGNRRGPARTYVNLMLVMLLGGLWHGASWNFVIWGGIHGGMLAFERAQGKAQRVPPPAAPAAGRRSRSLICAWRGCSSAPRRWARRSPTSSALFGARARPRPRTRSRARSTRRTTAQCSRWRRVVVWGAQHLGVHARSRRRARVVRPGLLGLAAA